MGNIITRKLKNGKTTYHARYVELDGRRVAHKLPIRSSLAPDDAMAKATAMLEDAELRVAKGLPGFEESKKITPAPAAPKMTVRKLAEKYKAEAQPDVWNLAAYRRDFWSDYKCNVDPYLGDRAAVEVKRTDVATWRDKMKANGKSARTIKRGLGALSVAFNWALELGHLPDDAHNPVEGVSKPSYKPTRELYKPEEVAALLDKGTKKAPELARMVAFAYFTGCRVGEIAALSWGDIDFQSHSINVHRSFKRDARKNGKPVVVGLHPHLRDILGPLAPIDDNALVFPDHDGKMRRKYNSKSGCWGIRELAEMANVRRLNQPWHSFRASHATALEEMGATPSDIMRALGQSSIQVAMRYAEASPRRAAERVASLPVPANVVKLDDHRKKATGWQQSENGEDREATVLTNS
jgi:integrase